jgi:hypothetical protein
MAFYVKKLYHPNFSAHEIIFMAIKPNYQFEKRQRELDKKKKKAKKLQKKSSSADESKT